MTVSVGVAAEADADAWLRDALARAWEANEGWERLAVQLREENTRLRAENERLRECDAQREAELERVSAELAVLQRLVFGRSSERARADAAGRGDGGGHDCAEGGGQRGSGQRRGAGRVGGITRICHGWK